MNPRRALTAAAVMLAVLGGLAAGLPPVGYAQERVLRRGNGANPESLDPAHMESEQAALVLYDLFEGLVTLDAADRPVPAAAQSWQISNDGLVYRFRLRPHLKWSDGSPLTADDFVFGIRRAIDPRNGVAYASLCYPILNAQDIAEGRMTDVAQLGVDAPDPLTVRFHLARPTPYFVALLANAKFLPVSRANVEKYGQDFTKPGHLLSNGAFTLQDWTPKSRLVLVRNANFRDAARVRLDKVIFYPIESETEEFDRYRAGDLDVTYYVPSQQLDLIHQNMAAELRAEPGITVEYIGFNLSRRPFENNPKLRQALSMAIDRQRLVDQIVKTGAPVAYGVVPAIGMPDYVEQPADWAWLPMSEKIAKAKRLYQEAGYGPDRPLQVELRISTGDNVRKAAIAITAMWTSVLGATVTLVTEDFNQLVEHRHKKKDLQMFWYSWAGDYPDATSFLDLFTSKSLENVFSYNNPAYDRLVAEAEQSADLFHRASLLQEAEDLLVSETAVMPLFSRIQPYLVKPWVKGYHIDPLGYTYDKDVTVTPH